MPVMRIRSATDTPSLGADCSASRKTASGSAARRLLLCQSLPSGPSRLSSGSADPYPLDAPSAAAEVGSRGGRRSAYRLAVSATA